MLASFLKTSVSATGSSQAPLDGHIKCRRLQTTDTLTPCYCCHGDGKRQFLKEVGVGGGGGPEAGVRILGRMKEKAV